MSDQHAETPPLLTMTQERFDLIANSRVDSFVTWQGELVREVRAQTAARRTAEQDKTIIGVLREANSKLMQRGGELEREAAALREKRDLAVVEMNGLINSLHRAEQERANIFAALEKEIRLRADERHQAEREAAALREIIRLYRASATTAYRHDQHAETPPLLTPERVRETECDG